MGTDQLDSQALADLLARATAVETQVKAALDGDVQAAAQLEQVSDAPAPSTAELQQQVEMLEDRLAAMTDSSLPGEDPVADYEAGGFDAGALQADLASIDDGQSVGELVGVKASWGACSQCGSSDVDEFADGTARCEDCGAPLVESKGVDYDEPDDEPVSVKELAEAVLGVYEAIGGLLEAKGDELSSEEARGMSAQLSELEVLMARREGLSAQ